MGRDRSGSGGAGSHQTGTHPEQSQEDKSEAVSGYFRQPWLNARTLPPPRISAGHCWGQGLGCQLVRNGVAESGSCSKLSTFAFSISGAWDHQLHFLGLL